MFSIFSGGEKVGRKLIFHLLCFPKIHIGSKGIKDGEKEWVRDVA